MTERQPWATVARDGISPYLPLALAVACVSLFGEAPGSWTLAGGALVMAALVVVARSGRA